MTYSPKQKLKRGVIVALLVSAAVITLITTILMLLNNQLPVWQRQTYINAPLLVVERILINPEVGSDDNQKPIFDLTSYQLTETIDGVEKYERINSYGDVQEAGHSYFFIDRQHHSFWLQGGWWYQGVYSLSESGRGTLLSYQVNNVAPASSRWLAPLAYWNQQSTRERDFQKLINQIRNQLPVVHLR